MGDPQEPEEHNPGLLADEQLLDDRDPRRVYDTDTGGSFRSQGVLRDGFDDLATLSPGFGFGSGAALPRRHDLQRAAQETRVAHRAPRLRP